MKLTGGLFPIGYLCLTESFCLAVYGKKPARRHLWMMRVCFGFKWRDA